MKPAKPARPAFSAKAGHHAFVKPRDKREELKTYHELELRRVLKSVRERRRVEARGKMRVIGNGSLTLPYLLVEAKRYRMVRLEHEKRLLREASAMQLDLPPDRLLPQLTPRIEQLAYAQLAEELRQETTRHVPLPALGRALTRSEHVRFADSHTLGAEAVTPTATVAALQEVLSRIEQRQNHNPARYQTIWAGLVGADAAAQSQLHRIDAATQTAYFRCHNSVLSMDLQRRPGLAQKLSRELGTAIRQLRATF